MNTKNQVHLGEEVRKQGGQGGTTTTELVFDPTTGEFRCAESGETTNDEEMVVTDMTREGFA